MSRRRMRSRLLLLSISLVAIYVAGCAQPEAEPSPPPATSARAAQYTVKPQFRLSEGLLKDPLTVPQLALPAVTGSSLAVSSLDGKPVSLNVGSASLVVGVATWCPISKQFVQFVQDKRIKAMLTGYTLTFIFQDEWDTVASKLKEQDPALENDPARLKTTIARMKDDAGGGPLYDPAFLDVLPGPYYLHKSPKAVGIDSFPTLFDRTKGMFDEHPVMWIAANRLKKSGMDADRFLEVWKSHEAH